MDYEEEYYAEDKETLQKRLKEEEEQKKLEEELKNEDEKLHVINETFLIERQFENMFEDIKSYVVSNCPLMASSLERVDLIKMFYPQFF